MANCKLPLVAFLVCIFSIIHNVNGQKESIPVLIWESSPLSSPDTPISALEKLNNAEFSDYLTNKLNVDQKPLILVFVENNLSLEDFSARDADNLIYFPQLKSITSKAAKVSFLPAVQTPLKVLKTFKNFPVKEFHYKDLYKDSSELKKENINIIRLNNAADSGDRPDMLKDHDTLIADLYSRLLKKYPEIFAAYTGKYPSWIIPDESSRKKRETKTQASNDSDNSVLWEPKSETYGKILFYFEKGTMYLDSGPHDLKDFVTVKEPTIDKSNIRFPVRYDSYQLYFRFVNSSDGYWTLKIEYETDNKVKKAFKSKDNFQVPREFSYHCSQQTIFLVELEDDNVEELKKPRENITFEWLQVQPYLSVDADHFDDAYDCVNFFTAGIWSGLIISFLLGAILLWGLSMIMDIHTNDRFDDPKGKTITITATD